MFMGMSGFIMTCGIWSLLYFMQLIPYVGYIAIVLKLMLKDTFIFTIYIAVFTLPYSVLFRRIRHFKVPVNECDTQWDSFTSSWYSNFLLIFNMMNFQTDLNTENQDNTNRTLQSQVFFFSCRAIF